MLTGYPRETDRNLVKLLESDRAAFRLEVLALDLYPGELTYIGGKSGPGTSTLMKTLGLESRAESGNL